MKPRVISYIRFSSQRQSKGRSEDRQSDAAREWCERNNMELDEHVQDLGVSAFSGRHRKKGNLSAFLDQVEAGKVPHVCFKGIPPGGRNQERSGLSQ